MWSLVRWWQRRHETPEQRALRQIRAHFAALGYPLDDVSDVQILDGVRRFGEAVAASQVTMSQAARALTPKPPYAVRPPTAR